jgi:hypothetical protein
MAHEIKRIRRRKKAFKKLEDIYEKAENTLVIHYSCESFYDRPNGKTPRITSIAVRNLASGQTESFSIHKVAEQLNIAFVEIVNHYNELEKDMLDEFFQFVNSHTGYYWAHWNMRDINYGFPAIKHRYRVLGGEPVRIEESKKFDLAGALINIYGAGYIEHPRFQKIMERNKITNIGFLTGQQEAEAFENREYVRLHQSTLRKVNVIATIFGRATDRSLRTNASWTDLYGISPKVIGEIIKEHWIFSVLGLVGLVISLITGIMYFF